MGKHLISWLWIALWPLASAAQDHCDVILPLAELQAALERVGAPGHRGVSQDLAIAEQILLRIDRDSVGFALRDHPLGSQTDSFGDFLDLAQIISTRATEDGNAMAATILRDPDIRRVLYSIGLTLRPYPCREARERRLQALQTLQPSTQTPITQQQGFRIKAQNAVLTLGLSVVLIILCLTIIQRQVKRLERKRRRKKRFYVRMPCTFQTISGSAINTETDRHKATIVDISSEGAKLLHHLNLEDHGLDQIALFLDGTKHTATVAWYNPHCAGVKFDVPIPATGLRKLVRDFRPRTDLRDLGPKPSPSGA